MSKATFIEANAGTGKTTSLTNFIIEKISAKLPLERVCALTFTEKAANEMVDRLRTRISELVDRGVMEPVVLDQLNQAFIGTIHGFCTQVLKRYGERIHLPPLFEVDPTSKIFDTLFETRWDRFLSGILKSGPPPYDRLIQALGIGHLRELAEELSDRRYAFRPAEPPDLSALISNLMDPDKWDVDFQKGWGKVVHNALLQFEDNRDVLSLLTSTVHSLDTDWKNAIKDVLLCRNEEIYTALDALRRDFVNPLLKEYRGLGYLRFDDLLLDTRDLLKNHFDIRRSLKNRFDLVLVDEMQDTDPVQYEIFLYLSETKKEERDFGLQEIVAGKERLNLQDDKLFVVGDPKQSIYGFRKADIHAYQMIKNILKEEGVQVEPLTENYRSCKAVVDFTNAMAKKLFPSEELEDSVTMRAEYCAGKKIDDCIHLTSIECDAADVQHLRVIAEANWLAAKIQTMVVGGDVRPPSSVGAGLRPARGPADDPVSYADIGILLRRLTHAHIYVDALCARNIPVVIEGEKHFYLSQEVIDFINLLKWIIDEMDSIALAGLLRSPLFGLNDFELAIFFKHYRNTWDVSVSLESTLSESPDSRKQSLLGFLQIIFEIRKNLKTLTPAQLVDQVLTGLPVLTVASLGYGTYRNEIAPLNILKIHKQALDADSDSAVTAYAFVRMLEGYSREGLEYGQEAVADEGVDAVRIMSIHRAKGLDFPILFLPLTDHGFGMWRNSDVLHDWKSDTVGLKVQGFTEANYLRLKYLHPDQEEDGDGVLSKLEEEERRVLYVATTRAKKAIHVSFVPIGGKDKNTGSDIFEFLKNVIPGLPVENEKIEEWSLPSVTLPVPKPGKLQPVLEAWEAINKARQFFSYPQLVAITTEAKREMDKEDFHFEAQDAGSHALLVGLMCHAVLERVDFNDPSNYLHLLDLEKGKHFDRHPEDHIGKAAENSASILKKFFQSNASKWLASAEIIGREVPVAVFSDKQERILVGTLDLLVLQGGKYFLIDHKTNLALSPIELEVYRNQMNLYSAALETVLGAKPTAKLCMIRTGEMVDVAVPSAPYIKGQQQLLDF